VPRRNGKAERSSETRWRTRGERKRKGKTKEMHKARKKREKE